MELSPSQLLALRNLARKRAGKPVDWIRISEAIALTDMGLATRGREGWNITPAGIEALEAFDPTEPQGATPPRSFRPGGPG